MTRIAPALLPVVVFALLATLPACVDNNDIVVDSTTDAVDASPGDGTCATAAGSCTLRAAIHEANARPGPDLIRLTNGATYVLSIAEPGGGGISGGDLDVTDTLHIRPAGGSGGRPTIEADGLFRVLEFHSGFTALDSLVIQGGNTSTEGGGFSVHSGATVWGSYLDIRDNVAFSLGGGIMNRGSVLLSYTQVRDNRCDARGGGIRTNQLANTTLVASSVTGNTANVGGGIHNQGTSSVFNTTVSDNTGEQGAGGIYSSGDMTLANATIAFNRAEDDAGSDPGGVDASGSGELVMRNTIIAQNTHLFPAAPRDCGGTLTSQGHNLVEDPSTCDIEGVTIGNVTGEDPLLESLAALTNQTLAHRPQAGSPVIDAGSPAPPGNSVLSCFERDQRGVDRVVCDMGARERN